MARTVGSVGGSADGAADVGAVHLAAGAARSVDASAVLVAGSVRLSRPGADGCDRAGTAARPRPTRRRWTRAADRARGRCYDGNRAADEPGLLRRAHLPEHRAEPRRFAPRADV